ncbi:MAG: hypothetical protein WCX71_05880 [Candidatus Buchananbacteria bacterium]
MLYNTSNSIILDFIFDFVYWPIWWYTKGFVKVLIFAKNEIVEQAEILGVGVWLKNLFTPMYGMYDWESRLISFLVRLTLLFFRLILLFVWSIFVVIFLIFWLILPIIIVWEIYLNLINL